MFESNFPIDRQVTSYRALCNSFSSARNSHEASAPVCFTILRRGERRMDSESILRHSQSLCLMMVISAFALPVSATSPIYRCMKDGQTVLTDKPCEGTITAPSSGTAATARSQVSAPESVIGEWRGQTQFQGAQNAQLIEDAHTVVPMALTFSADGKVSGTNADNGRS
jgi:hypothetical protein